MAQHKLVAAVAAALVQLVVFDVTAGDLADIVDGDDVAAAKIDPIADVVGSN